MGSWAVFTVCREGDRVEPSKCASKISFIQLNAAEFIPCPGLHSIVQGAAQGTAFPGFMGFKQQLRLVGPPSFFALPSMMHATWPLTSTASFTSTAPLAGIRFQAEAVSVLKS